MLNISLDMARGLAALWVFLYHIRFQLNSGLLRRLAEGGFLGVPLFFVISGYCMMACSRRVLAGQQTAGTFLRRRLRRIFPPFWASIVVVLAVPFAAAAINASHGGAFHWPAPRWYDFSLWDWLSLATLTRGLLSTGAAHQPYSAVSPVYWSLAIEVQFYLVITAGLLCRRRFHAALLAVTAGCIGFWWFVGPVAPGLFPEYWPMFGFGLALYAVLDRGYRPSRLFGRWTAPASAVAFAVLLITVLALTVFEPSESLERQTAFALLCGLIFWAGSGLEPWLRKDRFGPRALVGLGKMSYSVYLLHVHLASLMAMLVWAVVPRSSLLAPALCVLGSLALAYAFYLVCERRYAGRPGVMRRAPQHAPGHPETLLGSGRGNHPDPAVLARSG